MKITFRKDRNIIFRAFTWVWLLFKNKKERELAKESDEISIELITKKNAIALFLVMVWAAIYFSYQYNFEETPKYYYGILFTIEPTLFLQQFRHAAIDHFSSFFYVYGLGGMYILYWGLAFGSEKDMWKYGLAFMMCWIMQFTIQITVAAASPIRFPGTDVDFIRYEVFPASEGMLGIKYGAIPSGHIGGPIILFLSSRFRKIKWVEWAAIGVFVIFVYVLVYLGEHFVFDMLLSIILYPVVFIGFFKLADKLESAEMKRKSTGDVNGS